MSAVLVDPSGDAIRQLAPVKLSTHWFQELNELVELVKRHTGITVTILRLLEIDDSQLPELRVSYPAEADVVNISDELILPWDGWPLNLALNTCNEKINRSNNGVPLL